jgi:hypothetical protein
MTIVALGVTQPALSQDGKPQTKVSDDLLSLYQELLRFQGAPQAFVTANALMPQHNAYVTIDAVAVSDVNILHRDLLALGLQHSDVYGLVVSGRLPISAISALAALPSLRFARPAYAVTHVGLTTSQGDAALRADLARAATGVDGSGILVGTLSDSYNCLGGAGGDVGSGDLPGGVLVLDDTQCPGTDEGRGMMQLIHDVAPGASQAFHTADGGQAAFANGILDLASAGADVIVDDVIYFAEPMFQDGIIAQAVNIVVGNGAAYFSSAGNNARKSYESAYRPSGLTAIFIGGNAHDFDPGPGVDILQNVTIPVGGSASIVLQWDQPFFSVSGGTGTRNDIDVALFNSSGTTILAASAFNNLGGDAVEILQFSNPGPSTSFNIAIEKFTPAGGPNPSLMKYVFFGPMAVNEYATNSSTVYGHANAAGAEAVGAAFWGETPVFGVNPPLLETFSSIGGTPILFNTSGGAVNEVRAKPEIVGADGGNTTFFGSDIGFDNDTFPNFFGTSASAPHAAGVAALMLERSGDITPMTVYARLEVTTIDMGPAGIDFESGSGLIQADSALLLPGDCNGDGVVDAGDLSALTLEIFDSDGNEPRGVTGGTFAGQPIGCNANEDVTVDAGDISCAVLVAFEGQGACA